MIVSNSTTISNSPANRFDNITEIPADYTPSTIRKLYPDINDQKAYYQKLTTLTSDPSKLMDIGLSCASAMSWYEQKEYVKECVKNLTDEGITDNSQLAGYYSLMMSLASDNDEMMVYHRKYISILNKIDAIEQ